jgi:hypothetical protein
MPWNEGIFIVDLYKNVSNIYKPSVWSAYLKWGLLVLLRGGIVQSVPCSYDHLLICCAPHLNSDHS